MICVSFWDLRRCCLAAATWMRCHASQPIMAGSTRVVSSPLPETSLLARSCNKAERERYFVFGESLLSRFSRSSTTLTRDGVVPVASSKGRPNRTLTISRSSIVWCESAPRSDPTRISDFRDLACRSASAPQADAQYDRRSRVMLAEERALTSGALSKMARSWLLAMSLQTPSMTGAAGDCCVEGRRRVTHRAEAACG